MAKAPTKPPTKTEIIASIAEASDLSKKQVSVVFEHWRPRSRRRSVARWCRTIHGSRIV